MTRILPIFFSLFVFNIFSANAQSVLSFSGTVKDNRSNPIPAATVALLNTSKITISNNEGFFKLNNITPGTYLLNITAVGFAGISKEINLTSGSSENIPFVLGDADYQLDDIIVTAQKKEERLQQIPFAISALTAREVKDFRLWNTGDITAIVPNLYSGNSGDERNVSSIRGIGTTSYDPAVATYIDGVNQFTLDTYTAQLLDVERIEVLRGPQGTLYGRNAMGGVINIITKQPSDIPNAFAEVSFGNYNLQRYEAGFRTPLIKNKLYLGVAGLFNKRDGYYTNTFLNESFDKQHTYTGNYYLKYKPADKWTISLNLKHKANRNDGAFTLAGSTADAFEHPYELQQNAKGRMVDNTVFSSLGIVFRGNDFNFSSQTGYQSNLRIYKNPVDGDFSPLDAVTIINNYGKPWNKVKTWSQEFKLNSNNDSKLQWTAGTYLFADNRPNKQSTHYGEDAGLLGVPDTDFTTTNTTTEKSEGIAFYGQATYAITEKIDITGGLRYDFEHKSYNLLGEYQKDGGPIIKTTPDTSTGIQYGAFSPKVGLSYKITPNNNWYITYSRGFRTGGMTQLSDNPSEPPLYEYDPEFSNNIEMGIKNSLFNEKLHANLTVFFTNITGVQVPTLILPDAITIIRNAGRLESKGIELELSSKPVKGFQVDYNFGYTNALYTNLKLSQNGTSVDLEGKKQIYTPDVTSMLTAQYSFPFSAKHHLKFILRGEWFYLGKQYFDLSNNISQNPYSLFNMRAGFSGNHFDLMFWGRNLTGQKYIAYAYDFGATHLGNPRTLGVTLGVKI